jgi:hypothetical protein
MTLRKFFAAGAASAFLLTALAGSADAQGRGRGQDKTDKNKAKAAQSQDKNKTKKATPANQKTVVVFRDSDRATIHQYVVTQKIVAQPLPPGIAMNIARGKPLPPGIAKKVLPANIIVTGTRVDPNITYYFVGDRVVAVRDGNVIDILLNIFR